MNNNVPRGFLSDEDIKAILDKDIVICNYLGENLTDIGYNLTPTDFIFSVNSGLLVPIMDKEFKKYCWIDPQDTVLILTREAIWVSEQISGTFHSKVKIVSQGFGHISTTLDANWEGPLLISLNNPTKKRLKFVLGEYKDDGFKYSSFVTLIFYRMATPTNKGHDNLPCRIDILKNVVIKEPSRINMFSNKYFYLKDVVEGIKYESLGIGSKVLAERIIAIEKFKDKYTNFARNIEFLIRQAHSINREILWIESVFGWMRNVILALCTLTIVGFAYTAYKEGSNVAFYNFVAAVWMPLLLKFYYKPKGE